MRFSVDAHAIGRHLTGNEVYIRSLLRAFASQDKRNTFIAYVSVGRAQAAAWIPSRFETRRIAANPFLRLGFDLPRKLWQDRPNLVHVQYTAPLNCPVPVVVSVHDVSFLNHPEYFPPVRAWQLRQTVSRTVRAATRVLTGSEFSRDSIVRAYGLSKDRVVVVPNAAGPGFRPIRTEDAIGKVFSRWGISGPFILSVGDLQPRKNHIGLISAYEQLVRTHPRIRHHLVMVGKDTWFGGRVRARAGESAFSDRIHFPGFVSDEDLLQFYNACELFVFPSFYEGFGLPILEAMACGRAVTCSNTSAMPEVADGAAILFDPHSVDEMTATMAGLLLDGELRGHMERLGRQRAAQFTWQRTARKTLEVYYEVAGASTHARQATAVASLSAR
ncbi:MAG: glycosyltransferase family 1 protein [Bryobacteraceae bacterium]